MIEREGKWKKSTE